ncbi:MAG TPA: TolC family protein [Blastocatellia bacterium]|nr:TolC family protein [Blastocatellia bacterium]
MPASAVFGQQQTQQPPTQQQQQQQPPAKPGTNNPAPTPQTPPQKQPQQPDTGAQQQTPGNPLTREDAVRLALGQASAFQQAQLNEQIAAEDVNQARAAFLPKITAPQAFIYTTPFISPPLGFQGDPSFIAANAIKEFQSFINVSGDLDIAGRLRATLRRNQALLAAAHAGTEAARRTLAEATEEAYFGLAVSVTKRQGAELNLTAAQEFERITSLLFDGGEVPQVDLIRARLETANSRDDLEQARAAEQIAAAGLRSLIGYQPDAQVVTTDLMNTIPNPDDITRFTADAIARNPEIAQIEAQRQAAQQDVNAARAERRPQLSYSISGGFDSNSIHLPELKQHSGASAAFNLDIPIFDWGASKSRERQAKLRLQSTEYQRTLALRGFAQDFLAARTQATTAATRIQAIRASITDAERNVQLSIDRYRAGEAQIVEVTDAQKTLSAQRTALAQALFDYQVALARLRQVTGQ